MPIGIARYVRAERFDVAEIAIEVVDAWQRRGVGRTLARELSRRATRAGIRCFGPRSCGTTRARCGCWPSSEHPGSEPERAE